MSHEAGGARRWPTALIATGVAGGLALSGLSVWGIWQVPAHPATTAGLHRVAPASASRPSVEAAEAAILARRGAAVQAHDEAAFLADLDPTAPGLRTQQAAIFTGLAKLEFNRFEYHLASGVTLPQTARSHYDAPAVVTPILAEHQLTGYDTGPVVEAEAVTFVLRQGRWWIASDRDADGDLPAAGHAEPWDDGEIGVAHGKHSLVIGQSDDQATLDKVAVALDQAVTADLRFWPAGSGTKQWDGKVVVYVPEEQREFTSLFAGTQQKADGVVAVTVPVSDKVDFRKGGRGYGDVSGTRVIVNPKYFKPSSSFFRVVLRHEISHVAAEPITADGTPTWLVEGLAEYVGWRQADPSRTFFARGVDSRTATQINSRSYHLVLPPSRGFYLGSSASIEQRYTTGFLVCAYIQHRYGEAKLKSFATQMGAASTPAREPAVLKSALHKALGISQAQLVSGVDSWLRQYRIGHR